MAYPVTFDVDRPEEPFDKAQIVLRVLLMIVISVIAGSISGLAYWGLPVVAAILISQRGAERYLADAETGPIRWLRYIMGLFSYIALASDQLPLDRPDDVNLQVRPTGTPTVGSALLRIILAIPHAIVLAILGIAFAVVWLIAVISILIYGTYPGWAFDFIRGYLRWNARVLAYMASLVDEYPPFSFSDDSPPALPAAQG
jgi:hypothetical protein